MKALLAELSASITDLKKNPSAIITQSSGQPVVILNHNRPAAYLIPAETYEALLDHLDDLELASLIQERESEKAQAVSLDFDEL
ncbi:MAG: type II toxin-antitoxin system prevent-host-death family antitoxin [Deltaproteobacteria bacterium]|nr:type II toxin-antitoxin system prevent-host-death family antitoxin [Deltaproteobacteria bacterium]MBW1818467.1 type II toxin-antitoxin system prevent-host-death family antitoxin [Deltaproteobacteria bacterium]